MRIRFGLLFVGLVFAVLIFGICRDWKKWEGFIGGKTESYQNSNITEIRVKTARPKFGSDLEIAVEQPAEVAPYYRVELQSQVAGILKFLEKDIGQKVLAGEKLAEVEPFEGPGQIKSKAMLVAPFDGVIARRSADPGTFVANPAVVPGVIPLVVVERTDILTVSMRVPEAFVARVGPRTEAELRLDAMPGKVLRFPLTRLASSLDPADRTLRVEVDLFNGTADEHRRFLERSKANQMADLKGRMLPEFPKGIEGGEGARLLPGMYGKMKLKLNGFQKVPVIPSSAIVWRGGLPYLYRVESGIVQQKRIEIDVDNGVQSHVFWIARGVNGYERLELLSEDEVVVTNQGELDDGAKVRSFLSD